MRIHTRSIWWLANLSCGLVLVLFSLACNDAVGGSDVLNLCDEDSHCPTGDYCDDGVCVHADQACDDDTPCPTGFECRNGGCAPIESTDAGLDGEADGADGDDGGGDEVVDAPDIEVVLPLPSEGLYQLNFGNVMVGLTVEAQVVIRNAGTQDLQILDLNFEGGTDSEDFSVPQTLMESLPIVLAPGAETTIDVLYTATDGITDHSILDIISNDPDEALLQIHLLSEFKGEAAVAVAPDQLSFGDVPVGQSSSALGFVVSNSGGGNAVLTVEDIRFGLVANPDWSLQMVDADQQPVIFPALLNNGDFLDVSVTYHPQAEEADAEDVVIISNDATRPNIPVALTGNGVVGDVSADPSPLNLDQVRVGFSAQQVLTVTNSGGAALELTALALVNAGAEWSLDSTDVDLIDLPNTPHPLAPDESVELNIGFLPVDEGAETAELQIDHSGPGAQFMVAMSATGYIPAALTLDPDPAQLSFEGVQYDATVQPESLTLPIRLGNAGGENLIISDMRLANGHAEFSWEPDIASILVGQDQELRITFTPSSAGNLSERIVFETNDPDISFDGVIGRAAIDLSASAIDPVIMLMPNTAQDFGNLDIGAEDRITFTIASASNDPLWITAIQKGSGSSADFRLENLPDMGTPMIGIGTSRTFDVVYQPSGLGDDLGSVEVLSSDIGNPLISVNLAGTSSSCPAGWGDCDPGQPGCETDITSDMNHCGGCDQACDLDHASEICDEGNCLIVTCEGTWDDCDNTDSTGCEIDINTNTDHCQACHNDCAYEHANPTCTATGCAMSTCETDYWDLDGNDWNGCEYECTYLSATDDPDPSYIDANCDGIDGDISAAVFVSTSGNDLFSGTMSNPVQSLERAYELVAGDANRDYILVSAGTHNRNSTLILADGISIYGGYDPGDWTRDASNATVIQVSAAMAMQATNISSATNLSQLDIRGGNGADEQSSYGLFATASPALSFDRCRIVAGRGGDGIDGNSPAGVAASGGNGNAGEPGCEDSSLTCSGCGRPDGGLGGTSACGRTGGRGGNAGHNDSDGSAGAVGVGPTSGGSGTPEHQGNWNTPSTYWGRNGSNGAFGTDWSQGIEGYGSTAYAPSDGVDGGNGSNGNGGGGGGGGGGGDDNCDSFGGGGGGGGAGACAGAGAGGGTSAGGSFAIYLWNSNTSFALCEFVTAGGGTGGLGGTGQPGGSGGEGGWGGDWARTGAGNGYGGGTEQDDGSNGGRGGWGGDGGRGGHGGGGAGGPSIGVLLGGTSSPDLTDPTYTVGAGGTGGASSGNSGANGRVTDTYDP
ncbi:MAG: choice-of-anchor D domain-containing protein [Deltaproteobacteria bacterium]|nr:choice-of-anchor D domain-containing protein [Deltaproteobacteria bacterium]